MIEQDCNASTSRSLILTISETPIACILNFIHYPVTGRRCPQSGEGEDFLMGQLIFFRKTAVTPERNGKSKNRSQGGKLTVMPRAKNGSLTKIGVVWQKSDFWTKNRNFGPKKKAPTFSSSPCSGHDRKKLFKEKKCLCPNNQGGKCHFG